MRVPLLASAIAATLALAAPAGSASDFASDLAAAMAPYYGALVSSARGDAESTQRNLVLFAARWRRVAEPRSTAPAALMRDPEWSTTAAAIEGFIDRAQGLVRSRDLPAAHREIEGIRLALYRLRTRHGLETFDDRLTEYHESMERLATRASMYNEIILNDADYAEMARDLARANALWPNVEAEAGEIASDADWTAAAHRGAAAREDLARQIAARDDAAIARAANETRHAYFDLLSVLARASR